MKKIFFILSILIFASCSFHDQQVTLNFELKDQVSNIGNGSKIDVMVIDEREKHDLVGRKKISSTTEINIEVNKDLSIYLQKKIKQNLMRRGFVEGKDKIVEIHIDRLFYNAKAGFIGKSTIEASIRTVIIDTKTNSKFTKDYGESWSNKHFIMPLASTDHEIINQLLHSVVQDILSDDNFIQNLGIVNKAD